MRRSARPRFGSGPVLAAVLLGVVAGSGAWAPVVPLAGAGPAGSGPAGSGPAGAGTLAGGGATGRGLFLTYSDRDLVIDGGTVAAPDLGAPVAEAAIDLTGLGSALAALGYSPYSDAAGVLNAFGGTELPVGAVGERSRAKVTGRPPQESDAALSGPLGQARARLTEGPAADAFASAANAPGQGVSARAGEVRATVATVSGTAGSKVTVVLRELRLGPQLRIDSVTLSADARADGAGGAARATVVVEGATLDGTPVRLTPEGFEPLGPAPPGFDALAGAGIEVVGTGSARSRPGGRQSEARATGPRLRFRSPDGRLLTVVLGEAAASSTWVPGPARSGAAA